MTKTSRLGNKIVNRIGLGAMQLAGPGVLGPPRDKSAARAVLRRAIELGVDHIDTAQYYGPDVVNELIRDTLHPYPSDLTLVTKVGFRRDGNGAWLAASSPAELRQAVDDNLRGLGVERMHLVNLRLLGSEDIEAELPEQLGTLAELRDIGKLEHIGLSNADADAVRCAMEIVDLAEVQNSYSLVYRQHEDVVDLCAEQGIAFVSFFPLGSAFTSGPTHLAHDPAVAEVAARREATPAQIALAWLLNRGRHILVIPGTSSVAHLEENLLAYGVELDADDLALLETVTQRGDPLSAV